MKKKHKRQKRKHQGAYDRAAAAHTPEPLEEARETPQEEKSCLWTVTGELFQPIRLYYTISKPHKIIDVFLHLGCMEFVPSQESWFWLYEDEAQELPFQKRPFKPDKSVILGNFCLISKRLMYLNTQSVQRALVAIPFFDTYLPRNLAKITHLGLVNRLFEASEMDTFRFDDFFRTDAFFKDRSVAVVAKLLWIKIRTRNMQKRMALIDRFIKEELDIPHQAVEYLAVRYYKEGLQQLRAMLDMRQHLAIQHWHGNTEYSQVDHIKNLLQHFADTSESTESREQEKPTDGTEVT
jgi:hypothetical protein